MHDIFFLFGDKNERKNIKTNWLSRLGKKQETTKHVSSFSYILATNIIRVLVFNSLNIHSCFFPPQFNSNDLTTPYDVIWMNFLTQFDPCYCFPLTPFTFFFSLCLMLKINNDCYCCHNSVVPRIGTACDDDDSIKEEIRTCFKCVPHHIVTKNIESHTSHAYFT